MKGKQTILKQVQSDKNKRLVATGTTPVGIAVYPHLTKPDTKFDPNGDFHCKLKYTPGDDEWDSLIEQLETTLQEFADQYITENPKAKKWTINPVCKEEEDDEGDETGDFFLNFKQKAGGITKAGKKWSIDRIPMFDTKGQPIPDGTEVWGGSKMRVSFDVLTYAMPATKNIGLSLRLKAVQIIELVQGGSGGGSAEGYGFDEVEGGYEADTSPFNNDPESDEDEGDEKTGY